MHERHQVTGRLTIQVRSENGDWVDVRRVDNLITTAGKTLLARVFTGALQGHQLQVAVGGGGDAPVAGDTKLNPKLDQVAASFGDPVTRTVDGTEMIVVTVSADLPARGNAEPQVLREAGIVAVASNQPDVLYNHVTFDPISRSGSLEMKLTWEVMF